MKKIILSVAIIAATVMVSSCKKDPITVTICPVKQDETTFNSNLKLVKETNFSDNKLKMAENACRSGCMSTIQIKTITSELRFQNDRISYLKYAMTYCFDKENYHNTVDLLSFEDDRVELLNYINSHR